MKEDGTVATDNRTVLISSLVLFLENLLCQKIRRAKSPIRHTAA